MLTTWSFQRVIAFCTLPYFPRLLSMRSRFQQKYELHDVPMAGTKLIGEAWP